jgi:uncharacterized protein (DUF427 family)
VDDTDQRAETELKNAAWYYPNPKEKALNIKDYVAFCKSLSYPELPMPFCCLYFRFF